MALVQRASRRQPHDVVFGQPRIAEQLPQHQRMRIAQQLFEHAAVVGARHAAALADRELAAGAVVGHGGSDSERPDSGAVAAAPQQPRQAEQPPLFGVLPQALDERRIAVGGQHHGDDQQRLARVGIGAFAVLTQAGQHLGGFGVAQLAQVRAQPSDPKCDVGEREQHSAQPVAPSRFTARLKAWASWPAMSSALARRSACSRPLARARCSGLCSARPWPAPRRVALARRPRRRSTRSPRGFGLSVARARRQLGWGWCCWGWWPRLTSLAAARARCGWLGAALLLRGDFRLGFRGDARAPHACATGVGCSPPRCCKPSPTRRRAGAARADARRARRAMRRGDSGESPELGAAALSARADAGAGGGAGQMGGAHGRSGALAAAAGGRRGGVGAGVRSGARARRARRAGRAGWARARCRCRGSARCAWSRSRPPTCAARAHPLFPEGVAHEPAGSVIVFQGVPEREGRTAGACSATDVRCRSSATAPGGVVARWCCRVRSSCRSRRASATC